jgi:ATP-dependent helicase/nuclease subunit B
MLSKADLFARLAEGHAARVTVVTPNKRLSQALMAEFDSFQLNKNLRVWEAPDILPIGAFVERLWETALYSDRGEKLPLLLTPAQEQHLWERILEKSGLLIVSEAAAQCREAWRLTHQWRLGAVGGTEDANAFVSWSKEYQRQTRDDIDSARLPDLVKDLPLVKPKLLVAYAFDVLPPQTKELLELFDHRECSPEPETSEVARTSFPSAKHEIEAAAKWARARLEAGAKRIGVVVPELQKQRREVVRTFSRVMQPSHPVVPAQAGTPFPFNVSLGRPLSAYPLVDCALSLLRFSQQPLSFAEAGHLVRSPFLGGADGELARRAALDARLRRNEAARVSFPKLIAESDSCPDLRKRLEKMFEIAKTRPGSPAECARHFSALLDAAGFPGERAADSEEFQARAKWHEALGELAKLERISREFDFAQALAFLQRHCADTLFQAESPDAPIQVLGLIEAQGLRFDCLWVSGLTDDAWPREARANPFIPIAAQRKAGIPQAGAEASLALDRRITEDWTRAAREVVLSHPRKDQDRDLAPSPLILHIPAVVPAKAGTPFGFTDYPRYRDLLFDAKQIESYEDRKGPPVPPGKVRGGTRVLSDQAACPFRAFAKWRLSADELEEPADALDARGRGKLMHLLMKELWSRLRNSKALEGNTETAISQAAAAAVKEMKLEGRFAELERERMAKIAREWLELERRREPFAVSSIEEKRQLTVGTLEFDSRIDRMDKLEGGGHVLIDYKSARFLSTRDWEGPRPDDAQLPLYAAAASEDLAAVAYAKVRPGDMRFVGFSKGPNTLPSVKAADSWNGILVQWKKDAEALSKSFAAGEAQVDPKDGLATCRLCEMQTLCRVYEKLNALKGEGE